METPKRMSVAGTLAQISQYPMSGCRREGNRALKCLRCGGEICRVRAYMSLHDERFGELCIGPGRAWRLEIPYCSACEHPPSRYGCIHMSEKDLSLPCVLEASRPFGTSRFDYPGLRRG